MQLLPSFMKDFGQAIADYLQLQKRFFLNFFNIEYLVENNLKLGKHHFYFGNLSDATMRFKGVIFLRPEHAEAYYYLGRCHLLKNQTESAKKQFEKCLEHDKQFSQAQYFLAKMQSPGRIRQINAELLLETANFLSKDYATLQEEQGYQGGIVSRSLLSNHLEKHPAPLETLLDLGCMGGFITKALKEKFTFNKTIGIDLSSQAITALEKEVHNDELLYSQLITGDVEKHLPAYQNQSDIVLAINLLHYYSSIDSLFHAISQSLKQDGFFIGTFFNDKERRWQLDQEKDRFTHSPSYIKEEAKRYGLIWLESRKLPLYEELVDDEATFFICQKSSSNAPTVAKKQQNKA